MAWLKARATRREDEDQRLRKFLYAVNPPIKDELRRELRNGEIRHVLAAQNQAERDRRFFLAAEQDHDEVLDATLTGPMGPTVTDEMKHRAFDARAQRQHRNDYAGFQQNTLLLDFTHMLQPLIGRRLYGIGVDVAKIRDVLGVAVAREDDAEDLGDTRAICGGIRATRRGARPDRGEMGTAGGGARLATLQESACDHHRCDPRPAVVSPVV